jgi:transposase
LQLLLRLDKITLVWPDPERTTHGPSVNFPKPEAERSVQLFVMPDIGRMLELKRMMKVLKCTQRSASVLLFVTGLVGASIPASDLSAQEKIKLRDALVRSRVALINSIRFTLKSLGHTISNPSSQRFHKTVMAEVPQECRLVIAPVVRALEELSQRIKELDASLAKLAAERYPQTIYLQQVSGVGPITALYFVLKIGDPNRFERTRDVGAFVGLCPRRDQSGETDKELRISKCGDAYLRRLLVSAAQYILGPFGADSALRLQGLQMAAEGTAKAKKRAVVAVARKLAVLLLTLWRRQEPYEAFPAMG